MLNLKNLKLEKNPRRKKTPFRLSAKIIRWFKNEKCIRKEIKILVNVIYCLKIPIL